MKIKVLVLLFMAVSLNAQKKDSISLLTPFKQLKSSSKEIKVGLKVNVDEDNLPLSLRFYQPKRDSSKILFRESKKEYLTTIYKEDISSNNNGSDKWNEATITIPIKDLSNIEDRETLVLKFDLYNKEKPITITNNSLTVIINNKLKEYEIGFVTQSEKINLDVLDSVAKFPFKIAANFVPNHKEEKFKVILSASDKKIDSTTFNLKGSKNSYEFELKKDKLITQVKDLKRSLLELLNTTEVTITIDKYFGNKVVKLGNSKKKFYIQDKKEKFDENQEYNLFIGANFDLEEQLLPNTFYSEIDIFLPNIFDLTPNPIPNKQKFLKNWGLTGSIFKNNSVSISDNIRKDSIHYSIAENSLSDTTLVVQQDYVKPKGTTTITNLGLNVSLIKSLNPSSESNFKGFLSLSAEIIERRTRTTFENESVYSISKDTISITDFDNNINDFKRKVFLSNDNVIVRDYYDTYYGLGLIGIYNTKRVRFYYDLKFGVGNAGSTNRSTHPFGAVKFHLLEKTLGMKLNGELRKFFNRQRPQIVINLSKSINLSSLFGYKKNSL